MSLQQIADHHGIQIDDILVGVQRILFFFLFYLTLLHIHAASRVGYHHQSSCNHTTTRGNAREWVCRAARPHPHISSPPQVTPRTRLMLLVAVASSTVFRCGQQQQHKYQHTSSIIMDVNKTYYYKHII